MAVEAQLADGRILEFPDGTDPSVVQATIKKLLNQQQPQGGFLPAAKAGWENLKGDIAAVAGKAGLMGTKEAEEYIAERKKKAAETFKGTDEGWTDAPWTKFKETLGGSLPYMAAPAAAGAATLALPVTGAAATIAGMGAAGLASGAQFTGSNLSRQMDEGKKLADTDLGAAAAAAAPQAALDVFALGKIPGVRQLIGAISKDVGTDAAKKIAGQSFKQAAADYAKATGKAMGAEGTTEAAQQALERLQAGLSITDPDARKEYWDSFLGGAILGGTLAPAGRYVERGQEDAKQRVAAKEAAKAAEVAKAQEELDTKAANVARADAAANEGPQLSAYQTPLTQPEGGPARPTHLQPQRDIFGGEEANAPAPQEEVEPAQRKAELAQQIRTLQDTLETQRDTVAQATSPEDSLKAAKLFKNTEAALAQATQEHAGITVEATPDEKLAKAYASWNKAKEAGDVDAIAKHAARIAELKSVGATIPSEKMTQTSMRMQDFTGKSEPREEFYPRINKDELNQPTAKEAQESGEDYKGQHTLDKEATAQAIADMEKARLDGRVTEQQRLFPATEGAKAPTNNELRRMWMAELNAARKAKDRRRVDVAIENMRRLGSKPAQPLGAESKGAKAWETAGVIGQPKGAPAPDTAHMVDVTGTPKNTTAPDLRQQLRGLPTQDAQTEALLDRVHAKLDAVTASASARNMVGDWLHALRTGNVDKLRSRDVARMMDSVEKAVPVEQPDLFPEEKAAAQPKADYAPAETQVSRDDAANERRKAQQAALERAEATPTKLVSFAGQRQMRDFIADAPDAIRALEEQHRAAQDADDADAAASLVTRINKIKATQKRYEDQMSRTGEAAQRLRARIAKKEVQIAKWKEKLAVAKTPKARANARDELTKAEKQHAEMLDAVRDKRGIDITDVTRERPATEAPVAGERLEPRKIGPLVRKEVIAGEQRTGTAESKEGSNKTGTKAPVHQGGKRVEPKHPVGKKDMQTANEVSTAAAYEKLEKRVSDAENAADDADADMDVSQAKRDLLRRRADALREELRVLKGGKKVEVAAAEAPEGAGEDVEPLSEKQRKAMENLAGLEEDDYLRVSEEARREKLTLLADDVAKAVREGNISTALSLLAKSAKNDLHKALAEKLLPHVEGTKIKVVPGLKDGNGDVIEGRYNFDRNEVEINPLYMAEETLLHEVLHAATVQTLAKSEQQRTPEQNAAAKQLQGMFDATRTHPDLKDSYAASTLPEFVSEVYTNAQVRDALDGVGKPVSLLKRFWRAVMKLLGRGGPTDSEKVLRAIDDIMSVSQTRGSLAGAAKTYARAAATEDGRLLQGPKDTRSVFARATGGLGMWLESGIVDMRAPLMAALDAVGDKDGAFQAKYAVRKADQSISMIREFMTHGAPVVKTDEKGFHGIVAGKGPSMLDVLKTLHEMPKGFAERNNTTNVLMATDYMAAKLGLRIGADRLGSTDAALKAFIAKVDANPAAKKAMENFRTEFNKYNEQLINAVRDTGAITPDQAAAYLKNKDYIPLYRVRGGKVEMMLADNQYVSMGDIANTPFIHSLKGGNEQVLPLTESLLYNTKLMSEIALVNMAKRNIGYVMSAAGKPADKMFVRKVKKDGVVPQGKDVLTWNVKPENDEDSGKRYIHLDTEGTPMAGIPTDVLATSIEGFHATMPAFVKATAAVNDVLRAGITRTPVYVLRQLLRDPMSASSAVGLKDGPFTAVAKAMKEYATSFGGKNETLEELNRRGLVQSNILTGDMDDVTKLLTQIGENGSPSVYRKLMNTLDGAAHNADAATRALIWKDSKAQGLSDFEAEMRVMESMNFHKRGGWASIQYMARMVPFFNSGIQALNVAAKALQGKMPFEEELQVRQKYINNAMMLALAGTMYAAFMHGDDDDGEYGKLKPEDRYGNLHVKLPGGGMLRLPVGYAETGGLAWALGQAAYEQFADKADGAQAAKALGKYAAMSLPGQGSAPLPTGLKQYVEWTTNTDMRTFQDIVPARLQHATADQQYTNDTPAAYRALGGLGISPIKFQHMMNSILGSVATDIPVLLERGLGESAVERPELTPDQYPFLRGIMQSRKSSAAKEFMYSAAADSQAAYETFNRMRREGESSEALKQYMADHRAEIAVAPMAGKFVEVMGQLNNNIRIIQKQAIPAAEKTKRILEMEKRQKELAERYMAAMQRAAERLAQA